MGWQSVGAPSAGAAPRWSACAWPSTIRLRPPSEAAAADEAGGHRLDAGLEHRDPAALVLDQVDVHRLQREAAAHDPDALGDALGVAADRTALELGLAVERARHALLGGRAERGQQPDLAREGHAVRVGVLHDDLAVAQREEVEAVEVEPRVGRLDALERARARERAAGRPADRDLVALGDQLLDLEAQVRGAAEELGPPRAHAVGAVGVRLPRDVADARPGPRRRRSRRGRGARARRSRPSSRPAAWFP